MEKRPECQRSLCCSVICPVIGGLVLLVMSGCGGSDPAASNPDASAAGGNDMPARALAGSPGPPGPGPMAGPGPGPAAMLPGDMEPEMMMKGAHGQGPAGNTAAGPAGAFGIGLNQAPAPPRRPDSPADWTPKDIEDAVRERDDRVIAAIEQKVRTSPGDPGVVALLASVLATSNQPRVQSGIGGVQGFSGAMPRGPAGFPGNFPGNLPGDTPATMPNAPQQPAPAPPGGFPAAPGGGIPGIGRPGAGFPGGGPAPGAINPVAPGIPAATPQPPAPGAPGVPAIPPGGRAGAGILPLPDRLSSVCAVACDIMDPVHNADFREGEAAPDLFLGSPAVDSLAAMVLEASVGHPQAEAGAARPPVPGGATGAPLPGAGSGAAPSPFPGVGPSGAPAPFPGGAAGIPVGPASGGQFPGDLEGPGAQFPGGGYGYGAVPGLGDPASASIGRLTDRSLVESVVRGLMDNNSPDAWSLISSLLLDQTKTPIPGPESSEIIVESMLQRLDGTANPAAGILTGVVDGTLPLPAPSRKAAFRMMAAASAAAVDRLLGFPNEPTAKPDPRNPGSPGGFPGGFGGPGAMAAADGMAMMPGDFPGGGFGMQPGGPRKPGDQATRLPPIELSDEAMARVASFLWNPQVLERLTQRLQQNSDRELMADLLTLAASIPQNAVRKQVARTFLTLHPLAAGADPLITTGLFQYNTHDPGLLAALKALPRARPPRNPDKNKPTPLDSWSVASHQVVMSLLDRLRKSAPTLTPQTGAPPVRLHRDGEPEVSVMITLPGSAGQSLGSSAPAETTVYYTKTSVTPEDTKEQDQLVEHYEDRASGQRRDLRQQGILWIDGVRVMANGNRRTMDVIIQKAGAAGQNAGLAGGYGPGDFAGAGPGGGGGSETTYSIEIIVVETADPKETDDRPAAGNATTATSP